MTIENKVIMITGALGQIGSSLAKSVLHKEGKVVAFDIKKELTNELLGLKSDYSDNLIYIQTDIRDKQQINSSFKRAIDHFGRIDALVNNAGVNIFSPWNERTDNELDQVINVNLKGSINCLQNFLKHCNDKDRIGTIVNVASHYGVISTDQRIYTDTDRRSSEIYSATKAGIIQLTKYFATNALLDGINVRINAVAPGGVRDTENPQGEDFIKNYSYRCPMNRLAEVEEIVEPILFLISEESSYINGHTLVIDGGMSAW